MQFQKIGFVLLTALAFGSSIVFSRLGLKEFNVLFFLTLRIAIAICCYLIFLLLLKKRLPSSRKTWIDLLIVGLTSTAAPMLFFHYGILYISSTIFAIFIATIPLVTAFAAHFFIPAEKINKYKVLGLLVSTVGVFFLIFSGQNGINKEALDLRGPFLVILGVLFGALGIVYAKLKLYNEDPFIVSSLQAFFALIFLTPILFVFGNLNFTEISPKSWFSVLYSGAVGTFAGFWLTFVLVKKYGATTSSLPTYIMPAIAGVFGTILLGELISLPLVISSVVILAGVFLASK